MIPPNGRRLEEFGRSPLFPAPLFAYETGNIKADVAFTPCEKCNRLPLRLGFARRRQPHAAGASCSSDLPPVPELALMPAALANWN
jgi:hypothetical protein